MGERTDTRWLQFTDADGKGLRIVADGTFDFSAQHYTDRELWQVKYGHDLDKIRRNEVVLTLDCIQRGIGNASCGPQPLQEYEIKTEEQYIQFVASSKITFEFAADKNTATVTYDQGPGEVGGQGIFVVLYKIKGTAIVFYDSQEDMEKEIPAHEMGLFVGSTFELSSDKTTIIQSNIQPGIGTIKYKYSVVVK